MNDKPLNDLQAIYREAERDGMVKVGIPCHPSTGITLEWCWATRLSDSHARLDNCCLFQDDVAFGDVIEFREQAEPHAIRKEFVRVVSRGSEQVLVAYATLDEAADTSEFKREQLKERLQQIDRFLENACGGIAALAWEAPEPGFLCIALPVGTTAEEAERLLAPCPHFLDPSWL